VISRAKTIAMSILVILSGIVYFITLVADTNSFCRWLSFGAMIIIATLYCLLCRRCPKCNRFGLHSPALFAEDAGYCCFCGEKIEYK
jgi:hypothetical protein